MAESKILQSDDMESLLVCSICRDTFDEPKSLPCLHTFCKICIKGVMEASPIGWNSAIKCPVCRKNVSKPHDSRDAEEWSTVLPTNHLIVSLLDQSNMKKKTFCSVCEKRGVKIMAQSWCGDCKEAICPGCVDNHRVMTFIQDHSFFPLDEVKENPVITSSFEQFCTKHKNENIKMFCVEHDEVVCQTCATTTHRRCENVIDIEEAAKGILEDKDTRQLITDIHTFSRQTEFEIKQIEENMTLLEIQKSQIQQKIQTLKQHIIDHVDRLADNHMQQLEEIHNKSMMNLKFNREEVEQIKLIATNRMQFLNTSLLHATKVQLFLNLKKLEKQKKENMAYFNGCRSDTVKYKFTFNETARNIPQKLSILGSVESCNVSSLTPSLRPKLLKEFHNRGFVTDLVFLPDGSFGILEENDKSVIILSNNGDIIERVPIPNACRNIFKANGEDRLFALAEDGHTYAINLSTLKTTRLTSIGNIFGIACFENKYAIATEDSIQIIGDNIFAKPVVLKNIPYENQKSQPRSLSRPLGKTVAMSQLGCKKLVYIEPHSDSVVCVALDGTKIYKYFDDKLKSACHVTGDQQENAFVAGSVSKNIHMLSPIGSLIYMISLSRETFNPQLHAFNPFPHHTLQLIVYSSEQNKCAVISDEEIEFETNILTIFDMKGTF